VSLTLAKSGLFRARVEAMAPPAAVPELLCLLSAAITHPPIAEALEAGAVAVLAGLLGDGEAPELRREAVEALKLIATSGTAEHAQALIDDKACAALVEVLEADGDAAVLEAALCCLKHVSARVGAGGDGAAGSVGGTCSGSTRGGRSSGSAGGSFG
jgi:hypothetical protein